MRKNVIAILLAVALMSLLLSAFSPPVFAAEQGGGELRGGGEMTGTEDLSGRRFGVLTGSVHEQMTLEMGSTPAYYSEPSAAVEDLRLGRIDGFVSDLSYLQVLRASPGNEAFTVIEVPAEIFDASSGAISMNQDFIGSFNVFLAGLRADGTLEQMLQRWLTDVDLESPMPEIALTGENGTLTAAVMGTSIPFDFVGDGGELKGYCVELALRYAETMGMDIEFVPMDFSALIPYVISGKADFGIANIFITEERKQSVLFTDPFYNDRAGVLVRQSDAPGGASLGADDAGGASSGSGTGGSGGGPIAWLKTGIERNLITDGRWKMITQGLGVTMTIAVLAQLFGTVFGCFVCWLLMRKSRLVRQIANLYCGLIHGTPVVVLLMITYYIIFGTSGISNVLVAVAAFTMITAAGVAGNLKGAIETVDPVEIEAARSIGFSAFGAFSTVTLPQAVRRALPGYTNGFVELVKSTAVVGYIAIQDLTRAGDIIRSRTYDAYFPLLFVAVIYLVVTVACVQIFKLIVRKVNGGAV